MIDRQSLAALATAIILALLLGTIALNAVMSDPYTVEGVIIDKQYTPAQPGFITDTQGNPLFELTYERWTLTILTEDQTKIFDVPSAIYYKAVVGKHFSMVCIRGRLLNDTDCTGAQ